VVVSVSLLKFNSCVGCADLLVDAKMQQAIGGANPPTLETAGPYVSENMKAYIDGYNVGECASMVYICGSWKPDCQ
jgi:hypothetical protein